MMLEGAEWCLQEDAAPFPPLLRPFHIRQERHVAHMQDHRIIRCPGALVTAHGHRKIQLNLLVEVIGVIHKIHTQIGHGAPVGNRHFDVSQRDFYAVSQTVFLLLGHFRTKMGNRTVVAGQYRRPAAGFESISLVHKSDIDGALVTAVLHLHCRAVEANAYRRARSIQLRIIQACQHGIFLAVAWQCGRNQGSHQQACH